MFFLDPDCKRARSAPLSSPHDSVDASNLGTYELLVDDIILPVLNTLVLLNIIFNVSYSK